MSEWKPLAKMSCLYSVTLTTNARDAEMISAKFSALVSNSTKQFMYYLLGLQVYFDLVQPAFFWAQQLSHWELVRDELEIRSSYHMYFAKITRTQNTFCSTQGK